MNHNRLEKSKKLFKKYITLFQSFLNKLSEDHVAAFSAQTAFFVILSFFPLCILLTTIIQYTSLTKDTLLSLGDVYLPSAFKSYARTLLNEIYFKRSGTFVSISVFTALWLGSKGFNSMFIGLNAIYNIKEKNGYLKVRFYSIIYTIVFTIAILSTLTLLVFGNKLSYWITENIPQAAEHALSIINVRILFSGSFLLLIFLTMYKVMPNRKASFVTQFPGALFATGGWIIFSYLYSYYIDHISNYASVYGTMTTIAFMMIWLYACMYIIFLGGEINHVIQTARFFERFRDMLYKRKGC